MESTKLVQEDIERLGKYTLEDLKEIVGPLVSYDKAFEAADKMMAPLSGSATYGELLAGAVITIMRILARAKDTEKTLSEGVIN